MNRPVAIGIKALDLIGRGRRKLLKNHPNGIFAHRVLTPLSSDALRLAVHRPRHHTRLSSSKHGPPADQQWSHVKKIPVPIGRALDYLQLRSVLRILQRLAAVAEIPETVQIIPQNLPGALIKTVIVNHAVERLDHVVQRSRVPAA